MKCEEEEELEEEEDDEGGRWGGVGLWIPALRLSPPLVRVWHGSVMRDGGLLLLLFLYCCKATDPFLNITTAGFDFFVPVGHIFEGRIVLYVPPHPPKDAFLKGRRANPYVNIVHFIRGSHPPGEVVSSPFSKLHRSVKRKSMRDFKGGHFKQNQRPSLSVSLSRSPSFKIRKYILNDCWQLL